LNNCGLYVLLTHVSVYFVVSLYVRFRQRNFRRS